MNGQVDLFDKVILLVVIVVALALVLPGMMPSGSSGGRRQGGKDPFKGWTDAQKRRWAGLSPEERATDNQFSCPKCGGLMIIGHQVKTYQCPHCGKVSRVNW